MRIWTIRILGALNLLGIAGGACYLVGMLRMHWHRWPASASGSAWAIFWMLLTFNLYLACHLAFCSVRMIRADESALLPAVLLQGAQISSELANVIIFWLILPHSMSKIVFGLWDIALSGIDVQVYTGIAPLGVVVLLILMLSRYRAQMPKHRCDMTEAGGIYP